MKSLLRFFALGAVLLATLLSVSACFPLVEMANKTSPAWPKARTWREKIKLKS